VRLPISLVGMRPRPRCLVSILESVDCPSTGHAHPNLVLAARTTTTIQRAPLACGRPSLHVWTYGCLAAPSQWTAGSNCPKDELRSGVALPIAGHRYRRYVKSSSGATILEDREARHRYMHVLYVTSYYSPYVSGLSEHVRMVAEEMAKHHRVTVLTTAHARDLQSEETLNGVRVVRARSLFQVSRAPVSPGFTRACSRLARSVDVVHLHLPMADAALIAWARGRAPMVVTYHCDASMPGPIGRLAEAALDASCRAAIRASTLAAATSLDYLHSSRMKSVGRCEIWREVPPPIKDLPGEGHPAMTAPGKTAIGFCGRLVAEKGLDVLIRAVAKLRLTRPDAELHIAGQWAGVAGSHVYDSLIAMPEYDGSWVRFLGMIPDGSLVEFYRSLDVLALPSVNSFEAFGTVQVEAMLQGTPVVASDLPGVRTVVRSTGMGVLARTGDAEDLAAKLDEVLSHRADYVKPAGSIRAMFGTTRTVELYREMYSQVTGLVA